ncbi:MAG: hypothetical protein ACOH1H_07905 [Brevundimonas sp.]
MSRGPGEARGQAVFEAVFGLRSFTDEILLLGVARGRRSVDITSLTSGTDHAGAVHRRPVGRGGASLVDLQAREEDAGIIQGGLIATLDGLGVIRVDFPVPER